MDICFFTCRGLNSRLQVFFIKYVRQINDTSLPESNSNSIWAPLLEMLTLGHFATACCMILILVWAEIPWLESDLKTLSSSGTSFGPLLESLLPWPIDKGVSSLLNVRHIYLEQYYFVLTSTPELANDLT